jgi:chromosome segregation ATPase
MSRSDDFDDFNGDRAIASLRRELAEAQKRINMIDRDITQLQVQREQYSDEALQDNGSSLQDLQREYAATLFAAQELQRKEIDLQDLNAKYLDLKSWQEIAKMSPDKNTPQIEVKQQAYNTAKAAFDKEYGDDDKPNPIVEAWEKKVAALQNEVGEESVSPPSSMLSFSRNNPARHAGVSASEIQDQKPDSQNQNLSKPKP